MITTLELRPLRSDIYISSIGTSLKFLSRSYANRSVRILRYPDDLYDRSPKKLSTETMSIKPESPERCKDGICFLQLVKTKKSTLPPLINAAEIFTVVEFPQSETNQDEVVAIKKIQIDYGLSRISWQGDPCVPKQFLWDGLNCNNTDSSIPPTITSLNLSSSGLTDIIAPAIQNLTNLQELDLSNNDLTGVVPEFLANMKSLLIINLSGNNLSGQLPQKLLQKKGLKLNTEGNDMLLCTKGSCNNEPEKGGRHLKKSIVVPVVASLASMIVIVTALIMFFVLKKKKSSKSKENGREAPRTSKKKRFTYEEVTEMTNNFERILGKGGFGMVYHGYVNGTEPVAVKIVSQASVHGHKQFKAEVDLLLRVHHKNLVSLVGYCDKGKELALVYEYMANGDLQELLSGKRGSSVLRWGTRLKIAIEAAQGLEYLHKGCRPPIVHRDVKTANILLDENFQAKLADFGLSRSFTNEGESHVSTVVAGTLGYLDPEYYRTNWLTEKSDVYSFGVVLLEIITNQRVIDQSRERPHIGEWVELMVAKGDIRNITDPSLKGDYHSDSVWKFVELAMACYNALPSNRPTMSQVVIELIECLTFENSRGGTSHDMDSKGSSEVTMTFDTEVNPTAR
ncbi:hypothetical protein AALP_AA4G041600 [Arabis alpina]|uniref:non-specific serine/threonine protein kinase n=1 Tax=Arabis alpina TaxID=50452 RepID=A0A087H119_ARAAL|nr:hypothetical protein AALP_AA4G041600 [Arabis alpina]